MKKKAQSVEEVFNNPALEQLVKDHIISRTTMKDVHGITDKEMEALYTSAYNLYNHGKYKESRDIFGNLCQLDQFDKRYWMGLGAARQMLKDYEKAMEAYGFVLILDDKDPMPSFFAAECFMHMKQKDLMVTALQTAIDVAGDRKEYAEVVKQAKARLESATKEKK